MDRSFASYQQDSSMMSSFVVEDVNESLLVQKQGEKINTSVNSNVQNNLDANTKAKKHENQEESIVQLEDSMMSVELSEVSGDNILDKSRSQKPLSNQHDDSRDGNFSFNDDFNDMSDISYGQVKKVHNDRIRPQQLKQIPISNNEQKPAIHNNNNSSESVQSSGFKNLDSSTQKKQKDSINDNSKQQSPESTQKFNQIISESHNDSNSHSRFLKLSANNSHYNDQLMNLNDNSLIGYQINLEDSSEFNINSNTLQNGQLFSKSKQSSYSEDYSRNIDQGGNKINRRVENMDQVQRMKQLTIDQKKEEQQQVSNKSKEKKPLIDPALQAAQIEKLLAEQIQIKSLRQKEKEQRRKLYLSSLLIKLKLQITEKNEDKYSKILNLTRKLAKTFPYLKETGCLFLLDLEQNDEKFPMNDRSFFRQLRKLPKQLIYGMSIGQQLTIKMINKIFSFQWPNLKRLYMHRNVRQQILPKEVLYYVTENKNDFEFLSNFNLCRQLEEIVVQGNYFSELMGNTLFMQTMTSLKSLIIDYDGLISQTLLFLLLQTRIYNFDNADVVIFMNKKQSPQLRQLVSNYWEDLTKQAEMVRFLDRKEQLDNRPYIKEFDDFQLDDSEMKDQDQQSMGSFDYNSFLDDSVIGNGENQLNEPVNEKENQNQADFFESNINFGGLQPFQIANHLSGLYKTKYEFQSVQQLRQLMKDLDFLNKYHRYDEAMKQTKLLQIIYPEISEELDGDEEQTDVFILDFSKEQCFERPFTIEYLNEISQWNRFLFTAIAIDYRYHQPEVMSQLFRLDWENITSVLLLNVTYRSFYTLKIKGQTTTKKVRSPRVQLKMLKHNNLNERLTSLTLSGQRLPTYLARDLMEISFPKLQQLCIFFRKTIKPTVINLLGLTFRNLNPECEILIHTFESTPNNDYYKTLSLFRGDKQTTIKYWKERLQFVDYFEDQYDTNKMDYKQGFKSSEEEMDQKELDRLALLKW